MSAPRIATRDDRGVRVVALSGEVDHELVPEVEHAVGAAAVGGPGWVLDLSAVTYLDSAGLRMLLDLQRAAEAAAATLTVVPPAGGMALRALRVSGLDRRLGMSAEDP